MQNPKIVNSTLFQKYSAPIGAKKNIAVSINSIHQTGSTIVQSLSGTKYLQSKL